MEGFPALTKHVSLLVITAVCVHFLGCALQQMLSEDDVLSRCHLKVNITGSFLQSDVALYSFPSQ